MNDELAQLASELQRRGALPPEAAAILEELKRRGTQPAAAPVESVVTGDAGFAGAENELAGLSALEASTPMPPGMGAQVARQLGLGARATGEGLAGFTGIFTDPIAAVINQFVPPEKRLSTLQSVVSKILTDAGLPEPATTSERIVGKTIESVAGGGGQVAAARRLAGAVTSPVASAVAGQAAALPAAQLTGAAGAGAAAEAAREQGAGPVGQLGAGLVGGIAGGAAGTARQVPGRTAADVAAAEQAGVRLMTSDIMPPETGATRLIQRAGEAIPGAGTTGPRLAQQQERIDAVRNVLREYGATQAADAPADIVADLAAKRSNELKQYKALKTDVFDRLNAAGEVPLYRTMAALDDQIERLRRLQAQGFGQEIQDTEQAIRNLRAVPVKDRPSDWRDTLASLQADLKNFRIEDRKGKIYAPAIKVLEDWRAALPGKTISEIETLRTDLGRAFTSPDLATIRSTSEKAVSSIYAQLRDDMGDFIRENGDRRDFTKWMLSNRRLSQLGDELEMGALKRTLDKGEYTPEVVEGMLFSKRPSEIRQLYKGLTPSGQQTARAAILARAAKASEDMPRADVIVDPDKFAKEVRDLGESVGVFFKGDDLKRVEGLVRVLNLTRRAGEVAARTGREPAIAQAAGTVGALTAGVPLAGLYNLLGGGALGTLVAGTSAFTLGASARLYESAPVRNLLRRIAETKVGSPEERMLAAQLATLKLPVATQE